jgi:hypothetical protein
MKEPTPESAELAALRRHYGIPELGDEPVFLPHPTLDRLIDVVLALGAELWAERDRRRILEAVLAERGALPAEAIEQYRCSEPQEKARSLERDQFVRRVFSSLTQM